MATVTHATSVADTAGGSTKVSPSFTPSLNDLIVVFAQKTQSSTDDSPQLTGSLLSFDQIRQQEILTGQQSRVAVFVATTLAAASSQTVTYNHVSDNSNGDIIAIARIAGMTRTGSNAVKQHTGISDAAPNVPSITFGANPLTANPCLGCVGSQDNPTGLSAPVSFTTGSDDGYISPNSGLTYVYVNSGFTSTAVTWQSSTVGQWAGIILEMDTSAGGGSGGTPIAPDYKKFPKVRLRRN